MSAFFVAFLLLFIKLAVTNEKGYKILGRTPSVLLVCLYGGYSLSETADQAQREKSAARLLLAGTGVLLLAAAYFPVLTSLFDQWMNDPNYQHGILIPFVSAILLWKRRARLKTSTGGGGAIPGLIIIFISVALLVAGTAASELFAARISLPLLLLGITFFLMGTNFAKNAAFPLLFLLMMIPLPYIIYYKITFPMQIMSARFSAGMLDIINVSVVRKGNILLLPGYTLEVIAACSGLRSLMTMVTLALIFAAFSGFSNIRKIILVACAIPVAIVANTIRLTVTALGAYTIGPQFADGILHEISGLIVFMAGLLLLMLCAGILKWTR